MGAGEWLSGIRRLLACRHFASAYKIMGITATVRPRLPSPSKGRASLSRAACL